MVTAMISYWSVVLTFWISSITSKISWIFCWPWSDQVCLCECASVSVCNWFYKLVHGRQKQMLVFFVWKSHGKIMELFSEIFVGTLMITRLAWTTWTPMSAVPKRLLNLITHSLAAIFESSHYLNHYLLSHPSILGVTLCFCTGSYAAAAAAAAAGRRFLSTR